MFEKDHGTLAEKAMSRKILGNLKPALIVAMCWTAHASAKIIGSPDCCMFIPVQRSVGT